MGGVGISKAAGKVQIKCKMAAESVLDGSSDNTVYSSKGMGKHICSLFFLLYLYQECALADLCLSLSNTLSHTHTLTGDIYSSDTPITGDMALQP